MLGKRGLLQMFPLLAEALCGVPDTREGETAGDYLKKIAALNQLVAVTEQLRRDAATCATQKYLAHQIALLHVSACTVTHWWSPTRYNPSIESCPATKGSQLIHSTIAQSCLGKVQCSSTKAFKKRIAAQFDNVKAIADEYDRGDRQSPDEKTRRWLEGITQEISTATKEALAEHTRRWTQLLDHPAASPPRQL
jgi:hypothetical protein